MRERSEYVYQVRPGLGGTPEDVVAELSEAAWRALEDGVPSGGRRWSALQRDFLEVFKVRLSLHPGCGLETECASNGPPGPEAGPVYLLALRGGLIHFVEALAALAWRRLRADHRQILPAHLQDALHRAILPRLHYNPVCASCRVRMSSPQSRTCPGGRSLPVV